MTSLKNTTFSLDPHLANPHHETAHYGGGILRHERV